jgi:tRNA/rRNA methyltransferase
MRPPGTLVVAPQNEKFHVVLVEPAESLNVGSVARAMMNLGFKHLHLVRPVNYKKEKAAITACWATGILENLRIHDSYEETLATMEDVVGFSTREGSQNRSSQMVIGTWSAERITNPPAKTALVFGPEADGLRIEHVELCRCLVRIPSSEECPTFNLAQSVLIALYELSKKDWNLVHSPSRAVPDWNQFFQLDRLVEEVLVRCQYYRPGTPAPIPSLVKHMLRRMNPDEREMAVLLGLFSRIGKALAKETESVKEHAE